MPRYMRSITLVFLAVISSMLVSAGGKPSSGCFVIEKRTYWSIGNSLVTINIHKKTGAIASVGSTSTKKSFLKIRNVKNAGFCTVFHNATRDKWNQPLGIEEDLTSLLKNHFSTVKYGRPVFKAEKAAGSARLVISYTGVGRSGINLLCWIDVFRGSGIATFRMKITNNSIALVPAVVFPHVKGLKISGGTRLVWPEGRGRIIDNPDEDFFSLLPWPAPASMQWFYYYLNENKAGLYVAALDDKAAYKELRFGADKPFGKTRSCGVTFWPLIGQKEEWTSPPVAVGVLAGGWYEAADHYRSWLTGKDAGWYRASPGWVRGLNGVAPVVVRRSQKPRISRKYEDVPGRLNKLDPAGLDAGLVLGWHDSGQGTGYPDYKPSRKAGGGRALKAAVKKIAGNGDRAVFFMSMRLADDKSAYYSMQKNSEAMFDTDGKPYVVKQNYRTFFEICPSSAIWRNTLAYYQEALRDFGADGIWLGHVADIPARMCFRNRHGHASPATPFGEDMCAMLEYFRKIWSGDEPGPFEKSGGNYSAQGRNKNLNKNAVFMCAGIADAYGKYVDLFCPSPGLPYGRDPSDAPEVTRYTLPTVILGTTSHGGKKGEISEYGRAFVMGMPVLGGNPKCRRIFDIYDRAASSIRHGRFYDMRALTGPPADVSAGVHASEDGKEITLTFWNASKKTASFKCGFYPRAFGFQGRLTRAVDLENPDVKIEAKGKNPVSFPVEVMAGDVKAVQLIFE